MPNLPETLERIERALDPLPIRLQPMFGEHALYCDDRVFAFVCDDTLFLKLVPEAAELTAHLPRGEAYPGSKPYGIADDDAMADTEWLHEVVQTIAATQPHKPRKPRKTRGA
ncbi:TfoX/Sxy family protein [Agrococcus sp. SL85]|uniref:TfoX/Sxy family protein n=1 Tax=Agrococcus sp. SL85 TaxID=2995141 RepID=UPI00226C888F|nr:TfoX/Sxy family protein [Agrococcus sp. SL85]WAC66337.1 TfoX/Sxy family protein [Agrococcus sp. SL85]